MNNSLPEHHTAPKRPDPAADHDPFVVPNQQEGEDRPAGEGLALAPGKLPDNVVYFARALRQAGMPVGPGAVLDALKAIEVTPFSSRGDFRAMLHAIFVKHHEHSILFEQVFSTFWRRRGYIDQMIAALSPVAKPKTAQKQKPPAGATRVADALFQRKTEPETPPPSLDLDAKFTISGEEILRKKDFAQMSAAEVAEAMARIARLRLPADLVRQRRFGPDPRGRIIDPRRSFRHSLRAGGGSIELSFRAPRKKLPPIVAICDISGSVSDYSRVFLHFLHALSAQRKVYSFLFGTRLTNITRVLAQKDVDEALAGAGEAVRDWSGGTRIAASLHLFNKLWLRRVQAGSATFILFTDGLERDHDSELAAEMARLHGSCRRLIWLNPLLRYDAFQARALGIRTMLPYVDEFRPIHNLKAVADLCSALSETGSRDADPKAWLAASA